MDVSSSEFTISKIGILINEIRRCKQKLRHLWHQLDDSDRLSCLQMSFTVAELMEVNQALLALREQFEKLVETDK